MKLVNALFALADRLDSEGKYAEADEVSNFIQKLAKGNLKDCCKEEKEKADN